MPNKSVPEDLLAFQLKAAKIKFERQFKAVPDRRFAFDFKCMIFLTENIIRSILVDVQGGVWIKGGHTTGTGVTRDCEKYSLAAVEGYRVILCTPAQIKQGLALKWIEEALK